MSLKVGVERTCITPYDGVELTGWGYYIQRTWTSIRDHLNATAVAFEDGQRAIVLIALDLMVIDQPFTNNTRQRIHQAIGIEPSSILLTCSHSHNAPAAGGLMGVGECDAFYEDWASRQAATAAVMAWRNRVSAKVSYGQCDVTGYTFNRTRDDGPVDTRLSTLRVDRLDNSPLAMLVNFGAHPTVWTTLHPEAVTRDVPGEVCDRIERAMPGVTAVYIQGACGDVNFRRELSSPQRGHEPAEAIANAAISLQTEPDAVSHPTVVDAVATIVQIPTRRWQRHEIEQPVAEARRRLAHHDVEGWREGFGRVLTNNPEDMIRRHQGNELKAVQAMARFYVEWGKLAMADRATRREVLETEVQALRIGDLTILANGAELFSAFAIDIRRRAESAYVMIACYANGRIGYMPDTHDIAKQSYAAYQSPKYCDQFPFTERSGPALVDGLLAAERSLLD